VEDVIKMQPSKDIHAGANQLRDLWKNVMNEGTNIVKHLKPSRNSLKKRLKQQKDFSIDVDSCMPSLDSLCGANVRTMGKKSNERQENPSTSKENEGQRKASDSIGGINKMDACRQSKKFVSKSNSADQRKDKNQKLIPSTTPIKNSHISPLCEDSFNFTSEQPVQSAGFMQTGNTTTDDVSKGCETMGQAHEENTEISELEATALAAAEAVDAAVKVFSSLNMFCFCMMLVFFF
jgi:cytoskeletal protein RodZ